MPPGCKERKKSLWQRLLAGEGVGERLSCFSMMGGQAGSPWDVLLHTHQPSRAWAR